MSSEIDLSAAVLRYDEPVMYLIIKDQILLEPENIKEIANKAGELSDGKPYLLFSDARVNVGISLEGRFAVADKNILSLVGAGAILISSWPKKLLVNFFLRFSRSPFPIRLFTNAGKALDWLKLQRKIA